MSATRNVAVTVAIAAGVLVTDRSVVADLHAQAAPKTQAVVMKGRAPVSGELLKIKLPRPTEADLANGAHLMVLEDRRLPQISMQIVIPGAGGYYDPSDVPGLAQFTAAMMREGTPTRTTSQISEQLETMAASVNVGAGISARDASVSASSLTENFDATLSLAADVLLNPTFPEVEFGRYKERSKSGFLQQRTNPGFLATELFSRAAYGAHPASRITPTSEALDKATRAMLVDFHRTHYVPDHALIAIAGDISLAEARKLVEAKLGAWKKAGVPSPTVTDPPAIGPGQVSLIARPGSVQTTLYVGTQAISRLSPDYDVVSVMNQVIGGGPTGRLFTHLREEKGYTYGAYSNVSASLWRGSWLASLDVRTDVTGPALRDLMAEIAQMRDEAVPEKEFLDKRRAMIASFALSLESAQAVLGNYVTSWVYHLPADYWDTYPERIMAVTQAQVQAAAKKYLDPGRLQIIAVGDGAKIGELLKTFGEVKTYDTNGNRIGG